MKTEALAPRRGFFFYRHLKIKGAGMADDNKVNFVRLCMISY